MAMQEIGRVIINTGDSIKKEFVIDEEDLKKALKKHNLEFDENKIREDLRNGGIIIRGDIHQFLGTNESGDLPSPEYYQDVLSTEDCVLDALKNHKDGC